MVNPDGHEADTRYNAHGVDLLNRNYGTCGKRDTLFGARNSSDAK